MSDVEGRRPLKVRDTGAAKTIAAWLSSRDIHPNQISLASIGFAFAAGVCFVAARYASAGVVPWLMIVSAILIQGRLLCNLFDGMVAVEGGKSTASGELFNDIPDRVSDPLILIAAGYAVSGFEWGVVVGWAAGLFAVMTAYVRTLAASIGAPVDFRGPMAKQHRMALMTFACVASAFEPVEWPQGVIMLVALGVVVLGSIWTVYRRAVAAHCYLEKMAELKEEQG